MFNQIDMDEQLEDLAQKVVRLFKSTPPERRVLVAVAGPPGSGKSTLSYPLADRLNALLAIAPTTPSTVDPSTAIAAPPPASERASELALCVGLDGWHYSRKELDAFDDPVEAHWRRGAHWTFNLESYLAFLTALRKPLLPDPPAPISFPTFSHALKDPQISPFPIMPHHRIVIVEGLYTLLDKPGWRDAANLFDLRVWVECDREVARDRVIRRNFEAGIVDTLEKCIERVDASDMKNGDEVREHRVDPTDIITPADEPQKYAASS